MPILALNMNKLPKIAGNCSLLQEGSLEAVTRELQSRIIRVCSPRIHAINSKQAIDGSVHLHHEPGWQGRAAQAHYSARTQLELLSGRQNRRARLERLGKIHAFENHVGRR